MGLACTACGAGSRSLDEYRASPSDPRTFDERQRADLELARQAYESGDFGVAKTLFDQLAAARPDDLGLAMLAQEMAFAPAAAEQRQRIADSARQRAELEPSALNLLLAARVEPDPVRAHAYAQRALELAPKQPWTHYALGFLEARAGGWSEARAHVDEALVLDPGHRPARRLEAAILARSGELEEAVDALQVWLEAVEGDPRVSSDERALARLDLAQVFAQLGDDESALAALDALPDWGGRTLQRLCLQAAVQQGLGHPSEARDTTRAAQSRDPNAVMPLVQEALLLQHHLDDPKAALEAWQAVLARVRREQGLEALIQGLRARVILERAGASSL